MTELDIMRRAKLYMDQLAQGIDPISGEELPEDTVLNNVRLARCFFYVSGVLQQLIGNGGQVGKVEKTPFSLSAQMRERVAPADHDLRITEFADLFVQASGDGNMKRPSVSKFTGWLIEKGFMEIVTDADGKQKRLPTAAGRQIGIYTQKRQSAYGEYFAVLYSPEAQRFLLDHLDDILS